MFRDSLDVKKVDGNSEFESFEFSEWLITGNSSNVRLVIIYRPPYFTKDSPFNFNLAFNQDLIVLGFNSFSQFK